ncbi:MBL fold metallo-hydrolase [Sphingopyxis sp. GW247-27LB]|uniref:MBL fold metallo-hydrolase n=1 Tax=Sphingopyxis sp. GW247-27LB TaxID=2012632 RepID=UPI000BA5F8F8|nr:MBL fold metallo-hydrolase [Sphingopyxis sp. GW247-27LB]PAL19429.1 MBL fold metallo-hydrolase [Sphingopyxis sp. GW247-27LB]
MTKGRRIALFIVLFAAVVAAVVLLFQRPIGLWLFERGAAQAAARDRLADLPDGLHVALCGTGSPLPSRDRAGACTVVIAGKAMFVVDAGEGGARNISMMGLPNGKIRALFLTHYHSDHIDGLGPMMLLRWTASGNTAPLPVYGPDGVEAVIGGFNAAYAADNRYRTAHHGAVVTPPAAAGATAMPFAMPAAATVVYEADGLKVTAFPVDHRPVQPAVGYRFDYKGRSVVISGDTAPSASLETAAKGADLLIHEALQPEMVQELSDRLKAAGRPMTGQIMHDILDYHASPAQAADSARRAGVKMLVLSHIVPPLPSRAFYAAFLDGAESHFDGPIVVGEDGQYFSLPAGSREIERGSWF